MFDYLWLCYDWTIRVVSGIISIGMNVANAFGGGTGKYKVRIAGVAISVIRRLK